MSLLPSLGGEVTGLVALCSNLQSKEDAQSGHVKLVTLAYVLCFGEWNFGLSLISVLRPREYFQK